jgi:hypothetical protein
MHGSLRKSFLRLGIRSRCECRNAQIRSQSTHQYQISVQPKRRNSAYAHLAKAQSARSNAYILLVKVETDKIGSHGDAALRTVPQCCDIILGLERPMVHKS